MRKMLLVIGDKRSVNYKGMGSNHRISKSDGASSSEQRRLRNGKSVRAFSRPVGHVIKAFAELINACVVFRGPDALGTKPQLLVSDN